jgi:hypothetical protein
MVNMRGTVEGERSSRCQSKNKFWSTHDIEPNGYSITDRTTSREADGKFHVDWVRSTCGADIGVDVRASRRHDA